MLIISSSLLILTDDLNAKELDNTYSLNDGIDYNYASESYHLATSSSFGYSIGQMDLYTNTWIYDLAIAGAFSGDGQIGLHNQGQVMSAIFNVEVTNNKSNCLLSVIDSEKYVWSNPSTNNSTNTNLISTTLIGLIIDGIANAAGSHFPWSSALSLIMDMGNGANTKSINSESIFYKWNYNPWINNATQYLYFRADLTPGETATIEGSYYVMGMGFELHSPGTFTITISADGDHPHLDSLTDKELQHYNIYRVNKNNIDDYENLLKLTDNQKNQILNSCQSNNYVYVSIPKITVSIDSIDDQSIIEKIKNDKHINYQLSIFKCFNIDNARLTKKIINV